MSFGFELQCVDQGSAARAGQLLTAHGVVETPAFMPVGTQATVKAVTPQMVEEAGAQMVLCNTYHLFLRPGEDIVWEAGGLHRFMGWQRPILTDSGGFQVFSLAKLVTVTDDGIEFRSHIDGSRRWLSPESCIRVQEKLGADVVTCLDQPVAPNACLSEAAEALERTLKWAIRCLDVKSRSDQAIFGIVQGGVYPQLRAQSVGALVSLPFDGFAIGGLSLGEDKRVTLELVELCCKLLPETKPRYLMGVGAPYDIVEAVARGVDMFDCVLPTRLARHAAVLTLSGKLNLRNQKFAKDFEPIESDCDCLTCKGFSRAYIHHLFKAEELLAQTLATVHNLRFMARLMSAIRESILSGCFQEFRRKVVECFGKMEVNCASA
ncbi:MAG: tRNA guanosine(34) transglycosylase Tgt [Bacillota bacterium]